MIAGFAKSFPQYRFEQIVYEISYVNIVLYSSVLPGYDDNKEEDVVDATDPRNKEKIREILYG